MARKQKVPKCLAITTGKHWNFTEIKTDCRFVRSHSRALLPLPLDFFIKNTCRLQAIHTIIFHDFEGYDQVPWRDSAPKGP